MRKRKILIIEDEQDLAEVNKYILQRAGYEIFVACDGKEGIEKFEEIKPDLVLLDIALPKIDGFEVLRILRNNYPEQQVPIIVFTVSILINDSLRARKLGATDYIVKTSDPKELLRKIENVLPEEYDDS
ncbi:MAG: response regulator [Omnitrophica bacterium]|nr:response regulator [Candidatus Omnitrophota bacterium]